MLNLVYLRNVIKGNSSVNYWKVHESVNNSNIQCATVSYTHLDVYKRQIPSCGPFIRSQESHHHCLDSTEAFFVFHRNPRPIQHRPHGKRRDNEVICGRNRSVLVSPRFCPRNFPRLQQYKEDSNQAATGKKSIVTERCTPCCAFVESGTVYM